MKKLIATLLALAMVLSLAAVVSADELADVDAYGWWVAHSEGIEVKDGYSVTINFTNTTYETAGGNWNGPLYVVYSSDDATVTIPDVYTAPNYVEYWVQRGDNWGWGAGSFTSTFAEDFLWENYLPNMLAGPLDGTIEAHLSGSNLIATMTFNGITSVMTVAVDTSVPVYICLTGELTVLSNIEYAYTELEVEDTPVETPEEEEDTTVETPEEETPVETPEEEEVVTPEETTKEETKEVEWTKLADVDCSGWWAAHSEGVEIDEDGVILTFTNTTYATATNNWDGPIWILYGGTEGKVNGAGYNEYFVMRADNYGWAGAWGNFANTFDGDLAGLGIGFESNAAEHDWTNWISDLQAGTKVTIKAYLDGKGNAVVTMSCNGVTTTMTVPVSDEETIYLSIGGENCTLTNIQYADLVDYTNAQTGDNTNLVALAAALILSATGVVALTVSKKEF